MLGKAAGADQRRGDLVAMGRAGLGGWRRRVAGRLGPPVAVRTRLTEEQVEALIGAFFLVLATLQFVSLMRRVWRARGAYA